MDRKRKLRTTLSKLLVSLCLFGILWTTCVLWQQLLLPQIPGIQLPVFVDCVVMKPVLWGLMPCCILHRRPNVGFVIKRSWFSGSFPLLPCIVLLCLSLSFLYTLRLVQGLGNTFVQWDWMFLVLSLSAGIIEEVGFRGCFFHVQESHMGFWPAAVVSSTLFTLYHYPELLLNGSFLCLISWRTLLIFVMGIVFCWMLKKWNNLALNMVVHTIWDILSYIFCMF